MKAIIALATAVAFRSAMVDAECKCNPIPDASVSTRDECCKYAKSNNCGWMVDGEGCGPSESVDDQPELLAHHKLPGINLAHFADKRLYKTLPPVEAVSELVGDYLFYLAIYNAMPTQYQSVYDTIFPKGDKKDYDLLKITEHDEKFYPFFPEPMPKSLQRPMPGPLTKVELKYGPVVPLEYSRPLLPTIRWNEELIKKEVFTVINVVELAIIAWLDALFMNYDRFIFSSFLGQHNPGNLMLQQLPDGKFIYVPIDQGFAKQAFKNWFKWVEMDRHIVAKWDTLSRKPKFPKGYKQLFFHNLWLEKRFPRDYEQWNKAYKLWLTDTKKSATYFLNNHKNLKFFPAEVSKNAALKEKVIEIFDVVWRAMGHELVVDAANNWNYILGKISAKRAKNRKPNVGKLLPEKAKSNVKEESIAQWKQIQKAIKKQFKLCGKWKPKDEKKARERMASIQKFGADTLLTSLLLKPLKDSKLDAKTEDARRKSLSVSLKAIEKDKSTPLDFAPHDSAQEIWFENYLNYYDEDELDGYWENEQNEQNTKGLVLSEVLFMMVVLCIMGFAIGCLCWIFGLFVGILGKEFENKIRVRQKQDVYP